MNMKRMTLQEIQQVNLEMMKDIHAFCVKNGIHYSLAYGSLIGAIRHKGFIPWDDDIDIMMPRPDFDRFSREYKSEKGFRLSSVYDDDTYVNYTRVYDDRTLVVCPAKASKKKTGVWIDIYPIDGISDDAEESRKQFQRLRSYTRLVMKWRMCLHALTMKSIIMKMKAVIRLPQLKITHKGGFPYWHQQICNICKEHAFGSTKRCSSLVCMEANRDDKQEIFPTDDFSTYMLVPFEDQQFYVASGYDDILTVIFGDYMKIPPKDKQVSHIIHQWEFYWR